MVACALPVTFWYVAVMSASPGATPETVPALTVATDGFDEAHVAWLVTVCVVPSESAAVAENGADVPTPGAVPATATDATVAGAIGVLGLPQAASPKASTEDTTPAARRP